MALLTIFSALTFTMAGMCATYTVSKTEDTSDLVCDVDCSLREAIIAANGSAENDTIVFSALFNAPQTITLGGLDLQITNNGSLTITGPGAELLTVSGNNQSRVFTATAGANATISGVRITGGNGASTVTSGRGGGVYNNASTLTLNFVSIEGNTAANGGGLNNAGTATLNLNNSIVSGNTATGAGGGMQNFSGNTMNISNTLISGNTCNSTSTGGGAMQANGTISIVNSTITGNNAVGGSGAIYSNGTLLTITNTTIAGNSSTQNGAGIHRAGSNPLNIRNSIIASNTGVSTSPDVTGVIASLGNNIIGNVGTSSGWDSSDFQNVNPLLGPLADNGGFSRTMLPDAGSIAINNGQNCVVTLSCATSNPAVALTTDQRGISRLIGSNVDIGAAEVQLAVSVSGTVSTSGAPVPNATVKILFGATPVAAVRTNSFGRFVFPAIQSGRDYTIVTSAKGFVFQNLPLSVQGADISDVAIVATTGARSERK